MKFKKFFQTYIEQTDTSIITRHAELEKKNNIGTITNEEQKEARKIVDDVMMHKNLHTKLYTAQSVPDLNDFDFKFIGHHENGMAALGPGLYLLDNKNTTSYMYGKRGRVYDMVLSNDAFIVNILSMDQEHWAKVRIKLKAIAQDIGYASHDEVPTRNVSGLQDGRGCIGPYVKLLGREKARQLFIKHGIHGLKEKLPGGIYEYAIYDICKLKSAETFTGVPLEQRFDFTSDNIKK